MHGLTKPYHCNDCGTEDPDRFAGTSKSRCMKCMYRKNIAKSKAYHRERRAAFKRLLISILGDRCTNPECGFNKYWSALHVHHTDPTKKDPSLKRAANNWIGWPREKLMRELKHCRLLCANCHAAVHAGELVLDPLLPMKMSCPTQRQNAS